MEPDRMNRDIDTTKRQIFGAPFTLASGKVELAFFKKQDKMELVIRYIVLVVIGLLLVASIATGILLPVFTVSVVLGVLCAGGLGGIIGMFVHGVKQFSNIGNLEYLIANPTEAELAEDAAPPVGEASDIQELQPAGTREEVKAELLEAIGSGLSVGAAKRQWLEAHGTSWDYDEFIPELWAARQEYVKMNNPYVIINGNFNGRFLSIHDEVQAEINFHIGNGVKSDSEIMALIRADYHDVILEGVLWNVTFDFSKNLPPLEPNQIVWNRMARPELRMVGISRAAHDERRKEIEGVYDLYEVDDSRDVTGVPVIIPEGLNEEVVREEFQDYISNQKMSIGAAKRAWFMAHEYQDYNSIEANALFWTWRQVVKGSGYTLKEEIQEEVAYYRQTVNEELHDHIPSNIIADYAGIEGMQTIGDFIRIMNADNPNTGEE